MARSRNRPRPHLAWLIILALGLLALVATRAVAAPAGTDDGKAPRSTNIEASGPNSDVSNGRRDGGEVDGGDADGDEFGDGLDGDGLDGDGLDDGQDGNGLDGGLGNTLDGTGRRPGGSAGVDGSPGLAGAGLAGAGGLDRARDPSEIEDDLADPNQLAEQLEDGAIDDPLLRDAIESGVVFSSTAFAEAIELSDLAARHQQPSRFGRLDLTVAWRRAYHLAPIGVVLDGSSIAARDGTKYALQTDDTFLVLATWRI